MNIEKVVKSKWDLIVMGGGLAGVAAAIAARRQGLQVLLVEKAGYLGGAAAVCLVNPFMPYFTKVNGDNFLLSRGLFTELRERLKNAGGYTDEGEVLHEEYLKLVLDRMVTEAGVMPLYHAMLCGVEKEGAQIKSARVVTKAGVLDLEARYFIDATGDADLAVMAGCPYHLGRPDGLCQPMTLCFRVGNVDIPTFRANVSMMQKKYKAFQAEGKIKNPRQNILFFPTLVDGMVHFNTTRVVLLSPTDPFDLTRAEMIAREQMFETFNFLHDHIPGFEKSHLLYSGSEIGVRESRMIDGEYLLTEADIKACTKFDDAIAAANYDIDIHNPEGAGTSHYYFPEGTWYTIPYRSLLPKNANNLLVAGRCISSTHEAQASYRVMPIVTTLGEAAGVAAYVAAKQGVMAKDADIKEIQAILRQQGAFLG